MRKCVVVEVEVEEEGAAEVKKTSLVDVHGLLTLGRKVGIH